MPSWGTILTETNKLIKSGNKEAYDVIRKKYIKELADYTHRNVIVYATKWASGDAPAQLVSIVEEDLQGFMEAVHGLQGESLDLILHTGGGSGETTDAIVSYLRKKFSDIRVIIPQAAMSAGTMLACAADNIVMAKHSFIGPIDPQFILHTAVGVQAIPAHAITEQFERAQKEITANPKLLNSWLPMLSQYGPALLVQCKNQTEFSAQIVEGWLNKYMFKGKDGSDAKRIADHLSSHGNFKTHSKHINTEEAKKLGLIITNLEDDQKFQDRVMSAFHATLVSFGGGAVKIICNQNGNSFVKVLQQIQVKPPVK